MSAKIKGNAGGHGKVMRVDAGFFNVDGLVRAAESANQAVFMAQLEGRRLSPLESFGLEVLMALAGWKDTSEALESYQRYLKQETDK